MVKLFPIGFVTLFTFFSFRHSASPQIPDYIIYNGDTIATYNLILEQYLQNEGVSDQGKLFGLSFRAGASTNCWRGYQAIYQIQNDSLFLVAIIHCGERRRGKIDREASIEKLKTLFNNRVVADKVFIEWFSGDISFPLQHPDNAELRWDGVFYRIFEKETIISISNGRILQIAEVDNYEDTPKAIDRKNKSKLPVFLIAELKKSRWKNRFDCSGEYLVTIGENGIITKVVMPQYLTQDSIDKYWDRDEYNYCINNVFKALHRLKFDIIKDKGKPISEDVFLEIRFDSKNKIEDRSRK